MSIIRKIHKDLGPYMREKGLQRKGRYYYKIDGGIAYNIGFDNTGNNIHVYFFLMPLYIRSDFLYITYGERLNVIFNDTIPVLNSTASDEEISTWINIVTGLLDAYVLPFFNRIDSLENLIDFLFFDWEQRKKYIFCPPLETIRLLTYTLLYTHRKAEATEAIVLFKTELGQCTYLIDRIIQSFQEEVMQLECMLAMSNEEIDAFFADSIAFTKEMCFS